jgi:hypothetical protein
MLIAINIFDTKSPFIIPRVEQLNNNPIFIYDFSQIILQHIDFEGLINFDTRESING